jgi:site-specific recombinase XerD
MMNLTLDLVHESTLVGAVDSFLKELVHVRPFVAKRYAAVLEEMAERWLDERGVNEVNALDPAWIATYIDEFADPRVATNALQEFYRWAMQGKLIAENPLLALR